MAASAIAVALLLLVGSLLAISSRKAVPVASCAESAGSTSLYVGANSMTDLLQSSPVIVYGELSKYAPASDDQPLKQGELLVRDVLKGGGLRTGDVVKVCKNANLPSAAFSSNVSAVAFLIGRDQQTWVPFQGGLGIVAASSDGRFDFSNVAKGGRVVTLDELKSMIKTEGR